MRATRFARSAMPCCGRFVRHGPDCPGPPETLHAPPAALPTLAEAPARDPRFS